MPTLPQVAARCTDVDVSVRHATRDAHAAHALKRDVEVGVADLVTVGLPVIVGVKGQVVTPHIALSYHTTLLLSAAQDDLHIAMPACLDTKGQ